MPSFSRTKDLDHRQPLWIALAACLLAAVVLLGNRHLPLTQPAQQLGMPMPYAVADSQYYIAIAQGDIADVPSPYCKRVLYSLIAGGLAKGFHVAMGNAFVDLNFGVFALLAYALAALLQKAEVNPWWTLLALSTPLPLESLQRAYLPDLFHMALLALFFLLLAYQLEGFALITLLAAFLARDNTVVLCLVIAVVAWLGSRRFLFVGTLAVLLVSLACEAWFTHLGQPNRHHLPEFMYMMFLVPCSFLGNLFGLVLGTNAGGIEGTVFFHCHIPRALQFGIDHEAYAGFRFFRALETYAALLTVFGSGPLFIWYLWKKTDRIKDWMLPMTIAFVYGLVSYFLGTTVGRSGTFRLVGYAWPLFWIVLPYMFARAQVKFGRWEITFLAAAFLLVAWMPNLENLEGIARGVTWWLLLIPILYVASALVLKRHRPSAGDSP